MKKNQAAVFAVTAAVAAIGLLAVERRYFNVDGAKISEILKTGDSQTIRVFKVNVTKKKEDAFKLVVLNEKQKELFLMLLENTKFRRMLLKRVPYIDNERIVITAETSDSRVFFRLESCGGEFIIVDSSLREAPANHWRLRIQNDVWRHSLERIMAI